MSFGVNPRESVSSVKYVVYGSQTEQLRHPTLYPLLRSAAHIPVRNQIGENLLRVLFGREGNRVERDLRVDRRFVGIVDAREAGDLAAARLGIHALDIAIFADIERRVDEDLDKAILADQGAHVLALAIYGLTAAQTAIPP